MTSNLTPRVTGGPAAPATSSTELPHGRLSTYAYHRCRCTKCKAVGTRWSANKRRQSAYGRWQPLTDAGPVREHVRRLLAAGVTRDWISQQSGVSWPVLRNLTVGNTRGPSRRIRTSSAQALLSVPLPAAPPGVGLVPGTATRRRIQALAVTGYPFAFIARTAGVSIRTVFDVLRTTGPIRAATADRISAAYDQLWDSRPAAVGVRTHHTRHVQRLAAAQRWAPPLAWDDDRMHDPEALPDWTGRCGEVGGYYDHTQLGTPTCQPCRDAVRAAAAARKLRRRNRAAA